MFKGFRDFITRGNVVELAVAFVVGAAFASVVSSFVADIMTPLLGLVGLPDFSTAAVRVGEAEVRYGAFLNALISFVLVAVAIYFFVVVPMERLESPTVAPTKTCTECQSEIALAAKRCPMCAQPQPAG